MKKEKIGQSATKLLSRKSGEGSTTRIDHLKAKFMMMKSIGETMSISIVNPKCPTPDRIIEGEDIVWSFMKVNVRTMAKEMMEQTKNSILAQASQAMLAQSQQLP
ncbi:hypothetical protein ACDI16_09400, partial [Oceanobacillus caeni]